MAYEQDPLFLNPTLTALYDAQASWEDELVINGKALNRRQAERDFYLALVMAAATVLDVGCGTGSLLKLARERGHAGHLAGVEPAGPMLDIARRRTDIEWVHGDATAGSWGREFDLVVMTGHVFQVILEDEAMRATLAAIQAALADDGRLVFDTRNPLARDWEGWMPDTVWEFDGPDGARVRKWHELESVAGDRVTYSTTYTSTAWAEPVTFRSSQRFYSARDVAAFLSEAGLEIVEQFGHWDQRPFADDSPEIVTIARMAGR